MAGDVDVGYLIISRSCWSFATRRTNRLHGARRVRGMSQTPSSNISIAWNPAGYLGALRHTFLASGLLYIQSLVVPRSGGMHMWLPFH